MIRIQTTAGRYKFMDNAKSRVVKSIFPSTNIVVSTASNNNNSSNSRNSLLQQQRRQYHSLNDGTPYNLCFVRHGQSTWNRDNVFIGWADTPLTDDGVLEARVAGQMLQKSGMLFDEVHTSLLRRCIRTTNLVLMEMGQEYIPVHKHWRLNERNYGDLVGKNKKEVVHQFGIEQVKRWRRSYDEPPPPMQDDHPYHPARDPRYRLMLSKIPKSESLYCTMKRSSVYWDNVIAPQLRDGKTVLVVGHENNLRSLLMRLEGISPDDIINLSLPRAVPLAYRLDEQLKPVDTGKRDEATGFLRGEWLGGDKAVKEILERDHKQVYDTSIQHNLETDESQDKWRTWMSVAVGDPAPTMKAMSAPGQFQQAPTNVRTTGAVRCEVPPPPQSKMGVHKDLPDFSQKYCPSRVDDDDDHHHHHPKDQVASQ